MFKNYCIPVSIRPIKHNATLHFLLMLIIIIGGLANTAKAQDTVLRVNYNARLDSLHSGILKQERLIQVFLPAGYKAGSTAKYDVLYVLDGGNWNTGLIAQLQRFIENEGQMPPTIIVSVMGIDRNKDLTPTHITGWETSGEAANFLGYIKNELVPYINKNYPSNGVNTLWGHSLGAMFVIYTLFNEPAVFKSYIAVDPSLWWDDSYVPKMAASKLPALGGLPISLFITGRKGPDFNGMRIDTMEMILKKIAPASLNWKVTPYTDETHSSVRLKSVYDGLKFIYSGYTDKIEFHPMNGMVLKDKPFKVYLFADTPRTYYTLNGSVPTETSPIVPSALTLTGPATVTYKRITNRSSYDKTFIGVFTADKMSPAVLKPEKNYVPGGFNYAIYEGDWDTLPDVKTLKPANTGITNKAFDTNNLPQKEKYALVIDGFMEAKEDGYYIFFMNATKGSKLYLGNKLLINFNYDDNRQTTSYIVPLTKGFYHLRIEYLNKKQDDPKLGFQYVTPGSIASMDATPIPFDLQYGAGSK